MDDQRDALWADASLRRPAVDPGIPRPDRDLLAVRGALLPPAAQDRPARHRYYLPTEPARRLATIDGTVAGLTAAGLTALFGTTPLAVGVLIFQGPASWEMASDRFALLAAGIIAIVTTVILGVRVVRFGQPSGRTPAETAARTHHGRYLTGATSTPGRGCSCGGRRTRSTPSARRWCAGTTCSTGTPRARP